MTDYFTSDFEIGFTSGSMIPLSALATPVDDPRSTFHPYSQELPVGDGTIRGGGWANAEWSWKSLTQTQRDQLRQYITGQSAVVYIRTRTLDTSAVFATFQAVAIWPIKDELYDATRRLDFKIRFQRMIAA